MSETKFKIGDRIIITSEVVEDKPYKGESGIVTRHYVVGDTIYNQIQCDKLGLWDRAFIDEHMMLPKEKDLCK